MPRSRYCPAWQESIYHEVCAWIDQQRGEQNNGRPHPAWPVVDPDTRSVDLERTVPRVAVPDHLFGPWEVHERHLPMRRAEPPIRPG